MTMLDVYRDDTLIGHLRDADDTVEFEYAAEYLAHLARPISASLPLDPPKSTGARPKAFFGNLLPEGDIRDDLCRSFKVDSSDDLGLLSHIGAECAGALAILPQGERPITEAAAFERRYVALDDTYELGQYIQALQGSPSANFKGVPTRMSLAGAQSKAVVARFNEEKIYRSIGGATTHIIKIGGRLNNRGEEVYPGVVFNEYFCSRLAHACALRIHNTEMLPYQTYRGGPNEHVFCIERYDRSINYSTKQVARLHQEDFCQALGRPRTQKYEARGGISLADMFSFIRDPDQIVVPAISQRMLLKAILFNLIIGNRDAHAKNYSFMRSGFKGELAPLYDLVCTEAYDSIDRSLPQKIGKADHFEAITRQDFSAFGERVGIRPNTIIRIALRLCDDIETGIQKTIEETKAEPFFSTAAATIDKITPIVGRNIAVIRALLKKP